MPTPEPAPRWQGRLLLVVTGCLLAAFCLREDVQPDLYFHLAAGRWIWEHGLPTRNEFLAPFPQHAFVDHEWLFQWLMWPAWQVGGARLLSLLKALTLLGGFAALVAAADKRGPRLRWAVLVAAILVGGGRFVLRPEVLSIACAALYLWLLGREAREGPSRRTLIVLPLVQLLWSNAHGFSLIGPTLLVVTLATRGAHAAIARRWPSASARLGEAPTWQGLKRTSGLLVLVGVASLLNPYGLEAALYPFLVLLRTGEDAASAGLNYQVVELWSPFHPALAGQPEIVLYKVWLLSAPALWLAALARGRSSLEEGARAALLCASSLLYLRNLPFAALGLLPVTVGGLGALWELARERLGRSAPNARSVAVVLTALVTLGLTRATLADRFHQNASYDPRAGLGLAGFTAYPEACDFLAASPPRGPLFNNFGAGHYLLWRRGKEEPKPFICGNTDLYPGEHLRRYAAVMRGERPITALLDEIGASDVLLDHRVETPDPVILSLVASPAWALVHADRRAVVFRRAPAEPLDLEALGRAARGWDFPSEAPDAFPPTRLLRALGLLPRRSPNPLHRLQVAHLLELLGQGGAALDLAREAERLDPGSPLVLRGLASLEEAAGTQATAASRWRELAAADPRDALPWVKLGLAALRRGDARAARDSFQEALRRDPTSTLARQNLLAALEMARDALGLRAALAAIPRAERSFSLAKRSYYLGVASMLEEDWEQAAERLAEAVAADPSLGPAISRWAEVLGYLRRWEEAEAAWERLCQLTPGDASAWRALGRVRRVQENAEGALAAWRQAALADPREVEALLLSGALEVRRGDLAAARTTLAELQRRAPRDPRVAKLAQLVASLGG